MIDLQPIRNAIQQTDSYTQLDTLADALRSMILLVRDKQKSMREVKYTAKLLGDGTYYTIGNSKHLTKMQKRIEKKCLVEGCYWSDEYTYVRRRDAYGALPRAKIVVSERVRRG